MLLEQRIKNLKHMSLSQQIIGDFILEKRY